MNLIVIIGPTSSGKSSLAISLAKMFDGEIISADSRQVYRGMDLGSGKVTRREQKELRHHLLDVVNPRTTFSVAHYQNLADKAIADITRRKKIPFLVGGTPFYVDALVNGSTFPNVLPQLLLRKKLEPLKHEALYALLRRKDPVRARVIDRYNKRRLIRALEIISSTGKPVPRLKGRLRKGVLMIGIDVPRKVLKNRVSRRLAYRLRRGMIAEVGRLHKRGVSWKRLESLGMEYRWIAQYLQKKISQDDMKRLIIRDSMRFARRQMSWWKRDKRINWITRTSDATRLVKEFLSR